VLRAIWTVLICLTVAAPLSAQETDDPPADTTTKAVPVEPRPFRRLFVTLGRDIKRLPANDNAIILVNGGLLALAAHPFDEVATLGASSSHVLKATFSGWGKALGREWVQGGGALAAYVAGRVWDKPRMTIVAGDLIEGQLLSVTLTQGLKFATSRTRPDGEARSFPSGHASAAFATASVLHRHLGRKAAIPAYAVAVYTSASRLQANSHYASDVIVGAALGIAIGRTATLDVGNARLQVAPVPVTRGIAVAITTATK
jgi:membrane-associated phospholipid phosphatase